ncbi:MAG: VCBS repeat-containing protein [Alphaproteobacteria bacterium]|nr:VCBS repeat-containing protein [Alphaproteobacteria bacterium]
MWRIFTILCACFIPICAHAASIIDAYYEHEVAYYPHGVLGDKLEWARLVLVLDDETHQQINLPKTRVFEDIAPRLVDIDGDNKFEVMVVESDVNKGARLAIYHQAIDNKIKVMAATPFIGRAFRWLAPIGVADFDHDGVAEIAYIDRPHLAKRLKIWRFTNGELKHVTDLPNLTNHQIGWDFITSRIVDCAGSPIIITASGDWQNVMASFYHDRKWQSRVVKPLTHLQELTDGKVC